MDHALASCAGYAAILVGCVLEGETVLITAGLAAQGGYLSLPLVLLSAWAGAVSGDCFFFMLGHYKGRSMLRLRPSWNGRVEKVFRLIEKFGTLLIFGTRFLYGFRAIGPFAVGTARVKMGRFVILDLLSGLVWTLFFGLAGYLSSAIIRRLLTAGRAPFIVLILVLASGALAIYHRSIGRESLRIIRSVQAYRGPAGRFLRILGLSHGGQA